VRLCVSTKTHADFSLYLRYAEVFTDLAKLVFGGIIIGGVFEDMEHPIYLYVIGIVGFLFLLSIGTKYYNKGIKEK